MKKILISEKHGLNPTIPLCFYCGKPKEEIILLGRLHKDKEAPKNAIFDCVPCKKCASYMDKGIMLISVKDNCDKDNPYRTGKMIVIKEKAAKLLFPNIKSPFAFVEDSVWKKISELLNLEKRGTNGTQIK
ncbi:MAG: hypothetical protein ACTSXT_13655 [Candidatus Helarchaeota archaeon]